MDALQEELVHKYIGVAHSIAVTVWRRAPQSLELEEIKSIASAGLVDAVNRWYGYCETRGFDSGALQYFRTYASRRIYGAIHDSLRTSDWATRSLRTKARKLMDAGQGDGATETELAGRTGMSVREIRRVTSDMARRPISLDAGEDDPPDQDSVEELVNSSMLLEVFTQAIRSLSKSGQTLIALKYYENLELKEVARRMGLSEAVVSTLHTDSVMAIFDAMYMYATQDEVDGE